MQAVLQMLAAIGRHCLGSQIYEGVRKVGICVDGYQAKNTDKREVDHDCA